MEGGVGLVVLADLLALGDAVDELVEVEPLDVVDRLEEPVEFVGEFRAEVLGVVWLDALGKGRQGRPRNAQRSFLGVELSAVLEFADEVVVLTFDSGVVAGKAVTRQSKVDRSALVRRRRRIVRRRGCFAVRNPLAPEAVVLSDLEIALDSRLARQSKPGVGIVRWDGEAAPFGRGRFARVALNRDGAGPAGAVSATVEPVCTTVVRRLVRFEEDVAEDSSAFALDFPSAKLDRRHADRYDAQRLRSLSPRTLESNASRRVAPAVGEFPIERQFCATRVPNGMLSIALAGKPNAGKSTFYTAATMADVDVANYPFTTIDANRGVSYVRTECPCLEREKRCNADNCEDGKRYVPIELIDVAGLVPGAHEGKGLGNQFLDELTNADVIVNVIDASGGTNEKGEPVDIGEHDPLEDIDFVEEEMDLWLAGIVERNWESVERKSRSPDFDIDDVLADMLSGFGASPKQIAIVLRELDYPEDPIQWEDDHREELARLVRERTKPIVVAANKIDVAPEENVEKLLDLDKPVIPTTAEGELALRRAADNGLVDYDPGDETLEIGDDVNDAQRGALEDLAETMAEHGGTGVQGALNYAVYDLLEHLTAYPVEDAAKWSDGSGNVLPDAFLLPDGSTPVDLAYAVHSDIGDGYLHAVNAKTNREVGEEYELEEGDVIKIVSTN